MHRGIYRRVMLPIESGEASELIEAAVTAISILGGAMAYCSGYSASQDMDLMARFLKFPRGAAILSSFVSVAAGVAIVGFARRPQS
jgi:hypothetical protein